MNYSVEVLLQLRNTTLDTYFDGLIDGETSHGDLDAIAVELDRAISANRRVRVTTRAARVVDAILAESRSLEAATSPAKAARLAFWRQRRQAKEGPTAAGLGDDAEPDEIRMARPIVRALSDRAVGRTAAERVALIAERPLPTPDPWTLPASPDVIWSEHDRLVWEEFAAGVPCQGCGRAFLGDETRQHDGESWPATRERMAPIEAAFRARHDGHGTSWTVGGGPAHCRRCCAPHPLSPQQIERLSRLMAPASDVAPKSPLVRRCRTCRAPLEGDHVCRLADLSPALRKVVESVLAQERNGRPTEA